MTIKKISAILMLSVLPLGVLTAQEAKNYLPKAGDFAIGIDMQPIYSFFGNMANGDTGNGLATFGGEEVLNYSNNVTIMGKYMLDNTTALRVNVGIEKNIDHSFSYSLDDLKFFENPLSEQKVEDGYKQDYTAFSIAAGMEFRRGNNRIQGYCGADLVLALYKDKYTFQYGNAVTSINQNPSRTNYLTAGSVNVTPVGYWTSTYATETYEKEWFLGVAGKVGVEYFIVPQLSFGGEVSLLVGEYFDRGSYTKAEGFNPTTNQVETHTELVSPKSHFFRLATDNLGGKLFMMFYF